MQLYILNTEYETIGLIDEADSILYIKKYNDVGDCSIRVLCDEDYIELLKAGNRIFRYDDDMFCTIETAEIETDTEQGDFYTVTAYDFIKILSGRIIWDNFTYSGTFGGFWKKVLTENVVNSTQSVRNIPRFTLDLKSLDSITDEITYSTKSDDILQLLIKTCKTYSVGFRLSYDINAQQLVFRLYKGKNKATTQGEEYVEFSPTFANILSSHYKEDESNRKTFAVVGAKESDGSLMYITVYEGDAEPHGIDRKELYIDATNQSRDISADELLLMFPTARLNGSVYYITISGVPIDVATVDGDKVTVTDFTFQKMLEIIGYNGLAERRKTQEFTGEVDTIDTYQYKSDYDLGDIVKAVNDYGIGAEAQITEIWESEDSESGYTVEPKFEYFS